MEAEFDVLALKVLAGEATEAETKRLEQMLSSDTDLQQQFAAMRATWDGAKDIGFLAEAINAAPQSPPKEQLRKWESELQGLSRKRVVSLEDSPTPIEMWIQKHFFAVRLGMAIAVVLLVVSFIVTLFRSDDDAKPSSPQPIAFVIARTGNPEMHRNRKWMVLQPLARLDSGDEVRLSAGSSLTVISEAGLVHLSGPKTIEATNLIHTVGVQTSLPSPQLRNALFRPTTQFTNLLAGTRGTESGTVYSPADFSANLTPSIIWKSQPGKLYNVSIFDVLTPSNPPLNRTGVVSPLAFTNAWPGRTLVRNGLYRLQISENGNPLTEVKFQTLPDASAVAVTQTREAVASAYQMLADDPPRAREALALLVSLPPEAGNSDLALRLKLFAFGQLAYADEFNSTVARLEARP